MRSVLMLSLAALLAVGCGGDDQGGMQGPGGPDGPGGPRDGQGPGPGPERGDGGAMMEPGDEIPVELDMKVTAKKSKGTVTFLGIKKNKVAGTWMKGGQRPDFMWTSPEISLSGKLAFSAPLPADLYFLAVVNQDPDPLPGTGDLTSKPTRFDGKENPFKVVVDGHFGADPSGGPGGPPGGGGPGGPGGPGSGAQSKDAQGRSYDVVVQVGKDAPKGETRLMVLGRKVDDEITGRPQFFWKSEPFTATKWPHRLRAPLPEGLAVQVLLDMDEDGVPSDGDLASPADKAFAAPEGDPVVEFKVEQRLDLAGAEMALPEQPAPVEDAPPEPDDVGGEVGSDGGETRTLKISTDVRLPFIRTGRFMVVGLPPATGDFVWPPAGKPAFLWVSTPTKLNWPLTLEAKVPDGLDLIVVLDLDGSGFPDTGDLSSKPAAAWKRTAGGTEVAIELDEVIPVPDAG